MALRTANDLKCDLEQGLLLRWASAQDTSSRREAYCLKALFEHLFLIFMQGRRDLSPHGRWKSGFDRAGTRGVMPYSPRSHLRDSWHAFSLPLSEVSLSSQIFLSSGIQEDGRFVVPFFQSQKSLPCQPRVRYLSGNHNASDACVGSTDADLCSFKEPREGICKLIVML